jgi:murein DD-endopeptidase MepM/ murein hydrolase activator NlpD
MTLVQHRRGFNLRAALLAAALCLAAAGESRGDFYRYLDEDGVESFTNTPTRTGAVPVLREPRALRKSRSQEAAPTSDPQLPVQGNITSGIGWRHDPIDGAIRHHSGVDIAVPSGTPVKAIAAGTVAFSAVRGGYGNLVVIDHGDGTRSLYGHNSQLAVRVGDEVAAGQVVALSGSTGRSTGPHLHFELWKGGTNITETYLKTGEGMPEVEVAGSIRSYLHKDGSIVFTNLK